MNPRTRPSPRSFGLGPGLGLVLLLAFEPACSGIARDTATYERDTSNLLDTRDAQVRACYGQELERNRNLIVGTLTVTFTVNKTSGKLSQPDWDRNRTTVSETLATCVVSVLGGLELAEPDRRDGVATFRYSFRGK